MELEGEEEPSRPLLDEAGRDIDRAHDRASGSNGFEFERQAERALLERPAFSLRMRLAISFAALLVVSLVIAVTSWVVLTRLEKRLGFLEVADRIDSELLQARRFEKNFFLYGEDLDEARGHVAEARRLVATSRVEFGGLVGVDAIEALQTTMEEYESFLADLSQPHHLPAPVIEDRLRTLGGRMLEAAERMSARERAAIEADFKFQRRIPLYFLAAIAVVSVAVGLFLTHHILRRLKRLDAVARRIGEGDFTPVMPTRPTRDEFTNLAIALNHMMAELDQRHRALVRSHKLRAVGRLTAGIAHELNNPINNIMLTASLLEEDFAALDESDRIEMVRDLVEQSDRARRIVRNLLDFARESEMAVEALDIGEVIRHSLELVGNQLRLAKVRTEVEIEDGLPPVHGDANTLAQVFVNLFMNAADALPDGGDLTVVAAADSGEQVTVRVTDTGCGIPEHLIDSIFDPFFTTKPTGRGTGLGLSVSLGIVRKHGGNIVVESTPGRRTTFTVTLPATSVPALYTTLED
ncbi:MAG: HAMP domain-containing sensor histidine kinase [Acidobacteriota bacterium]